MDRRSFTATLIAAMGQAWPMRCALAVSGGMPDDPAEQKPAPTLGGIQLWADEVFFHDWHIQRNALTGHYRLLDGKNRRHASGTLAECRRQLDAIKAEQKLPPMRGKAVVLLHGLCRTPHSMSKMAAYLGEQGGYRVFNITYPTTREPLASHAASLARVVESLEGIEEVNFVAHSLGNLVIRHYLGDCGAPDSAALPDRRINRIVMLGPPNQGARLAEVFGQVGVLRFVMGPTCVEMGDGWQTICDRLATPNCEFGIIAGGRSGKTGFNPLLREDNDLIVSVESTRLAGAADFRVVPTLHAVLMDSPQVQKYSLRFLERGFFDTRARRQPIPA